MLVCECVSKFEYVDSRFLLYEDRGSNMLQHETFIRFLLYESTCSGMMTCVRGRRMRIEAQSGNLILNITLFQTLGGCRCFDYYD